MINSETAVKKPLLEKRTWIFLFLPEKKRNLKSLSYISSLYVHFLQHQSTDSSDEETLHIDTEAKPEVKSRNSKVKKKSGSAAGILDLLQASKQVGGIDYGTNR